jgi:hypothetical protein
MDRLGSSRSSTAFCSDHVVDLDRKLVMYFHMLDPVQDPPLFVVSEGLS